METNHDTDRASSSPWLPPRWFIRAAWKIHRGLHRLSGGRLSLRDERGDRYGLARLTTTGRRSGKERSVMIGYYRDGDDVVTMAMNGWDAAEPAWWLNLRTDPHAQLELPDGSLDVVAHEATGEEHDRLWDRWRDFDKELDGYASRRPEGTAVVVLSPTSG